MFVSPLAEVVRDRRINAILETIRRTVRFGEPVRISPRDVYYIRRRFARALELGQKKLYEFARFILKTYAKAPVQRAHWVVMGRCDNESHTDMVSEAVEDFSGREEELLATTDSELSLRHSPLCKQCRKLTVPVVSYTRFEPAPNLAGLLWLQTRVKTTSNTAYKLADMVFDIDYLFRRDKIYNEFSQVVTDVYGLKAVLEKEEEIQRLIVFLRTIRRIEVVEEKDYTGANRKLSGFEAFKIVLRKKKQLFEVQAQSKEMYERESSSLNASHRTYKERLMLDRRKLGKEYLQVYQALTKLLTPPSQNFCEIDPLALGGTGKGLDDEF